jgi:hypothetical protein
LQECQAILFKAEKRLVTGQMSRKNGTRGVYCDLSYKGKYVIIADYGRGVKGSLLPVVPSISTDLEAVEMAFTKQISGRTPEQRGNGLKFVSETVRQNQWHLFFQSGNGTGQPHYKLHKMLSRKSGL